MDVLSTRIHQWTAQQKVQAALSRVPDTSAN
jgi:hypothetical protein